MQVQSTNQLGEPDFPADQGGPSDFSQGLCPSELPYVQDEALEEFVRCGELEFTLMRTGEERWAEMRRSDELRLILRLLWKAEHGKSSLEEMEMLGERTRALGRRGEGLRRRVERALCRADEG